MVETRHRVATRYTQYFEMLRKDRGDLDTKCTKDAYACNSDGEPVKPESPEAVRWDILGMIRRHDNAEYTEIAEYALTVACYLIYRSVTLLDINDTVGLPAIVSIYDKAIEIWPIYEAFALTNGGKINREKC